MHDLARVIDRDHRLDDPRRRALVLPGLQQGPRVLGKARAADENRLRKLERKIVMDSSGSIPLYMLDRTETGGRQYA